MMMGSFGSAMGGGLGGGLGLGLGSIVPLLLIGLIVWAIIHFARTGRLGAGGNSAAAERPLAILKARYAKGELDSETFERMRQQIEE